MAPPRLRDVQVEDLKDTDRTLTLSSEAVSLGWVSPSEADRLRFVAAAEHALAVGKGNPAGLFVYLVRGKLWRYLTQEDEDRAHRRLKALERGPTSPAVIAGSSSPSARPILSDDALMVRKVRLALVKAGYRGDPYPQVRRYDSSWTKQRWDQALAELDTAR